MHLLIVKGGWGRFISMHLLRRKGCLQMRVLRRWGRGRSWVSHMAGSSHSIPACRGSERKNRRSLLLILRWQPWPTFHKDRLMQTWWYAYNRGARRALPEVSLAMRRQLGGGGLYGGDQLAGRVLATPPARDRTWDRGFEDCCDHLSPRRQSASFQSHFTA